MESQNETSSLQQKALAGSIVSLGLAILTIILAFFLESTYVKVMLAISFFSSLYSLILGIKSGKTSAIIISLLPIILAITAFAFPSATWYLFGLVRFI